MKITGISGSPNAGGNNEKILEMALGTAEERGHETEKLLMSGLNVMPCTDCGVCKKAKECPIGDEIGSKTVKDTMNMICETLARFK